MSHIRAKRVSNYELFFDLAFVLVIGRLTSAIHLEEIGPMDIATFLISNIGMLNIWMYEVIYFNKYGDSRRIDIYTVIPLMFVMGNLGQLLNLQANPQDFLLFNGLVMVAYGIIALQYYLKGRTLGFSKDIQISIATPLFFALTLLPLTLGWVHHILAVYAIYLIPNILPVLTRPFTKEIEINFPHAVERSQLVTILSFGELVIAIISTYPLTTHLFQGALLFVGMGLLFMFYMIQTFVSMDHHRRSSGILLFYAHLPILIGLNLFTVSVEFLSDAHHVKLGWIFFMAGLLLFYLGVAITSYYNAEPYRLSRTMYLLLAAPLALGMLAMYLVRDNILFLSLILIIMAYSINRLYMAIRKHIRTQKNMPHPDIRQNPRDFR